MLKQTEMVTVSAPLDENSDLVRAASILREGGLVAFPTETVYGLGADALNPEALQKIYQAKGRPSDNPLIVHIAEVAMLASLTTDVPPIAHQLIDAFWPGPLTLVLPKAPIVPELVTGGLATVAVRMPDHPVALALLQAAGVPVAAPSANLSGKPSPTTAQHVWEDLTGKIEMILDGGPVGVGVESTVLDITMDPPLILRPGGITAEQLAEVLGELPEQDPALAETALTPRSPGMKYTHYAPAAPLILVEGSEPEMVATIQQLYQDYSKRGLKVGIMATQQTIHNYTSGEVLLVGSRTELATVAARLYSTLREFDTRQVQVILAEGFLREKLGTAIMNRLTKAAHQLIAT